MTLTQFIRHHVYTKYLRSSFILLLCLLLHIATLWMLSYKQQRTRETPTHPPITTVFLEPAPVKGAKLNPKLPDQTPPQSTPRHSQQKHSKSRTQFRNKTPTAHDSSPQTKSKSNRPLDMALPKDFLVSNNSKQRPTINKDFVEQKTDNAQAIGMENINSQLPDYARPQSAQESAGGGIFSIENRHPDHADLLFYGWNNNFKRDWLQRINVHQGNRPTLEFALIDTMIKTIRQYKKGDFQWRSFRLKREITLSARLEDTQFLQNFLMREFFPAMPMPHN